MRKLTGISQHKNFEVSAKSLQKGDSVWVGKRVHRVTSNKKTDFGDRVIRLAWGSRKKEDEVILIVNPKLLFNVTKHKTIK